MTKYIREFSGINIGIIDEDGSGNKTVKAYSGKILGYYDARNDVTKDFYGRVLYRGDMSGALILMHKEGRI